MEALFVIFAGLICFIVGVMVGRLKKKYDGVINVLEDEDGWKKFQLEPFDDDLYNLDKKKSLTFKVESTQLTESPEKHLL